MQKKQRVGWTVHLSNPTFKVAGGVGRLKVRMAVFTLIISPFFLMVTIRASVTPCFLSCVNNSSLVVFLSSGVLRTPFEVFSVLCGYTFTGTWANSVIESGVHTKSCVRSSDVTK